MEEPKLFISYSHDNDEHKDWVLQLATRLRSNGVDVLLDRWKLGLGQDLAAFMERGLSASNRVLCVCSDKYVEKANSGTGGAGYEKQIITAELLSNLNTNWVIPLIRNNELSKLPTFLGSRLYLDFKNNSLYEAKYEELLREILNEPVLPIPDIGKNPFEVIKNFSKQKFIPNSEKYVSPATRGKVTFDYSNNNGCYFIGQSQLLFEIDFSKAGSNSIHLYNDPKSIRSISIAKGQKEITDIKDARNYDTSSRVRTIGINKIALLQNSEGFYAAIKVLSINDDARGSESDEVVFEYLIQTNGSPDFTNS